MSTTGTKASTVGAINPFRYRGYVYDTESGLYYLQSRYYNPEWGRFVNGDGIITGTSCSSSLYCYCNNNPINISDPSGCIGILEQRVLEQGKGPQRMNVLLLQQTSRSLLTTPSSSSSSSSSSSASSKSASSGTRSTPTKTSSKGVQFIADYESFHAKPYDDGYGNLTIGYGHLVRKGESFNSITKEEALSMLANDLGDAERRVVSYSASLGVAWDQNQFDALVSLSLNSGNNVKGVIDLIVAGNDVHSSFSTIIKANGQKSLGLYRRRMDEADIFVYGTYNRTYRGW